MPELLLELGCEELPASFVRRACDDLREAIALRLKEKGIAYGDVEVLGTPRRLIVAFDSVEPRQPDEERTVRGPSVQAAYGPDGAPSKALEGFCRGQGVDPTTAKAEGDYVYVTKHVVGRPTEEILTELLPEAIRSLTFDKSMRWAGHRMRFARPIRWILAAYGGHLVSFSIEGVQSGLESRGHRFNHPEPFEATSLAGLVSELRNRDVEPSPEKRLLRIREGVQAVSAGMAVMDEKLIEENTFLTEWPTAVLGTFDERYLELPEPVLVTVMAKHERFFPVREGDSLTNKFVSIRNGGVDEVVAAGNAWVLGCRFNDAKFFFDEDRKHTLDEFLERTSGIVFQAELGTVRQRADRLRSLCETIAVATGADEEEIEFARLAGYYAKADLSTGLVGELDELQGVVGSLYAKREGLPRAVICAVRDQYRADLGPDYNTAEGRTTVRLILADQLDKLAGYLGLGLIPSGSSDPYGLRRAAGTLLREALYWKDSSHVSVLKSLEELLMAAVQTYHRPLADPVPAVRDLIAQRCEKEFGGWVDLSAAILAPDPNVVLRPRDLDLRWAALSVLHRDVAFVQAATRPLNIVAAAEKKGIDYSGADLSKLDSREGEALLEEARRLKEVPELTAVRTLQSPIDAFFDSTMVMADDPAVRDARLAMLREVCDVLLRVGDFSKLVIPG